VTKTKIANASDISASGVTKVSANGKALIVSQKDGKYCAIANKCPHLGLPLAKGKVADGNITCPFHGSKFDLCTGKNVVWVDSVMGMAVPSLVTNIIKAGKAPTDVASFAISQEGEELFADI
jgi:nitrite reductase/ring-hydroxylating ferredoxin subunit